MRRCPTLDVEPRNPCWIGVGGGIAVGIALTDGIDGTPEDIPVFAVPARDRSIGHGDVEKGEEMRVIAETERPVS